MARTGLPVTIDVSERGAVSITTPTRIVGMSPFSDRAKRITLAFGPGEHVIRTERDVEDIPEPDLTDILEALA